MLQQSTLQFLRNLRKNNNKEWFDKNRTKYDNAKADFEALTIDVLKRLCRIDESIAWLQPKDCMFRINRDVRFSKNKAPYKTNMAMYISKKGKTGPFPGYYFHLEPGASFAAAGIWMPMPAELKKVRQEIDYNYDDFKKIVESKKFRKAFGDLERTAETALSRPPKGYDAENPAIEYLKLKSVIASVKITDEEVSSNNLSRIITNYFSQAKPLINFLNQAVDE